MQNFWHFLANFAKFCKIFRNPQKFRKIFRNPQNFCKILQNFLQNFTEMCRFWKMLKNAILDAKICENFAEIWRNFDKKLTKILLKFLGTRTTRQVLMPCSWLRGWLSPIFWRGNRRHIFSMSVSFSRLRPAQKRHYWRAQKKITNFCIQYSIFQCWTVFQNLQNSFRKSCKILQKLQKFWKDKFAKFCKFCKQIDLQNS